jgi:hypothetical protein
MDIPDIISHFQVLFNHWNVEQENKKINDHINAQTGYNPEMWFTGYD